MRTSLIAVNKIELCARDSNDILAMVGSCLKAFM